MATLEHAIAIAVKAHQGQTDKAGTAYILHPIRVMLRMHSHDERIVAVLHDVVEDSDVTLAQLQAEGFSEHIIAALDALTKRPGEDRIQAAHRAAGHPLARAVKLADNSENMDLTRLSNITHKDIERQRQYQHVREILLTAEAKNQSG
ncbi:guanosine-3',5'-bis(diphosphate) 3'-pyrophosphohydrolase [Bacterioplanes sanyensis]|uniref:Guanosine-3',5'-bis(Diphosphate) 3'-pyrophosphohydrolase n=1 Tax=Bacterioplanes sanyensis TaxID=1249553 RepID=A0A222FE26_9GAMM|nr:bifunctional (p)ppGpp synthetase/guanosine-3',5'-bis(diphosphate) 3'-pyrophosphohydrolase [Bacterioplanes sanyensis]ASP37347.1 guanosine-3',5'-bis(diphosphate) 3'-pyrophosphohydrolase [Bacterioplanes sanyensis]